MSPHVELGEKQRRQASSQGGAATSPVAPFPTLTDTEAAREKQQGGEHRAQQPRHRLSRGAGLKGKVSGGKDLSGTPWQTACVATPDGRAIWQLPQLSP